MNIKRNKKIKVNNFSLLIAFTGFFFLIFVNSINLLGGEATHGLYFSIPTSNGPVVKRLEFNLEKVEKIKQELGGRQISESVFSDTFYKVAFLETYLDGMEKEDCFYTLLTDKKEHLFLQSIPGVENPEMLDRLIFVSSAFTFFGGDLENTRKIELTANNFSFGNYGTESNPIRILGNRDLSASHHIFNQALVTRVCDLFNMENIPPAFIEQEKIFLRLRKYLQNSLEYNSSEFGRKMKLRRAINHFQQKFFATLESVVVGNIKLNSGPKTGDSFPWYLMHLVFDFNKIAFNPALTFSPLETFMKLGPNPNGNDSRSKAIKAALDAMERFNQPFQKHICEEGSSNQIQSFDDLDFPIWVDLSVWGFLYYQLEKEECKFTKDELPSIGILYKHLKKVLQNLPTQVFGIRRIFRSEQRKHSSPSVLGNGLVDDANIYGDGLNGDMTPPSSPSSSGEDGEDISGGGASGFGVYGLRSSRIRLEDSVFSFSHEDNEDDGSGGGGASRSVFPNSLLRERPGRISPSSILSTPRLPFSEDGDCYKVFHSFLTNILAQQELDKSRGKKDFEVLPTESSNAKLRVLRRYDLITSEEEEGAVLFLKKTLTAQRDRFNYIKKALIAVDLPNIVITPAIIEMIKNSLGNLAKKEGFLFLKECKKLIKESDLQIKREKFISLLTKRIILELNKTDFVFEASQKTLDSSFNSSIEKIKLAFQEIINPDFSSNMRDQIYSILEAEKALNVLESEGLFLWIARNFAQPGKSEDQILTEYFQRTLSVEDPKRLERLKQFCASKRNNKRNKRGL